MERKSLIPKMIQVIKIIDEYTLIIDIGSNRIEKGTWIAVYEKGPEIRDTNKKLLGTYDFTKAKLRVTEVYENFSVAKHEIKSSPLSMDKILGGGGFVTNGPLPLKDKSEITRINPINTNIVIGDLVKII